jgi:energy-converting hydrogenase Eha subunit C
VPITNKVDCLKVGGQWYEGANSYDQNGMPIPVAVNGQSKPVQILGNCNPDFTKQQEFNNAQKVYNRNIFIMLFVLGAISLFLGAFIFNEIISLALSWGGVLSLIIASIRYWSDADNWIKVLILAIALAALIWVAIKKFGK